MVRESKQEVVKRNEKDLFVIVKMENNEVDMMTKGNLILGSFLSHLKSHQMILKKR